MANSFYRAVWRWHFYAGFIILPVLAWLAVTGSLYLYKPEIERTVFGDLVEVPDAGPPEPVSRLVALVEQQTGGRVTQVARPAGAGESWRFAVTQDSGARRLAFVRPDNGRVLGTSVPGGPVDVIKQLHSLAITGPVGNVLVEIVAGWAIILVLTGSYLWWPRGATRALSLAGRVGERRFWRNLHASVGVLVGSIILFLAVTGMPWTVFWGSRFHALVAAQGIGRPAAPAGGAGGHDVHLPWSLQGHPAPAGEGHGDVGIDRALAIAGERGIGAPWTIDLPAEPGKPYRVARQIRKVEEARLISIDASSGKVLQDVGWSDFGPGAKAFEWGITTHQGQQFGEANRLIMLAGCLGVLLLTISAPIMWWKRRRPGRIDAPQGGQRGGGGVAAIMIAVGLLFPLTGASMIAALLIERMTVQGRRLAA